MTLREQFERKYPSPEGVTWNHDREVYVRFHEKKCDPLTYRAYLVRWEVWKASREGIVITLPNQHDQQYQEYFEDVDGGCFNYSKYLNDVHAVLAAAGMKVVS